MTAHRSENRTRVSLKTELATARKPNQSQSENRTSNGSKTEPEDQFKNRTCKKEVNTKQTLKQQHVDESLLRSFELLVKQGIAKDKAKWIAETVPADEIKRQVCWLPHRNIRTSKAGFLVKACTERYPKPSQLHGLDKADRLKRFHERRDALREVWAEQPIEDRNRWQQRAQENTVDPQVKLSISFTDARGDNPHQRILDEMAIELGLEPINLTAGNNR